MKFKNVIINDSPVVIEIHCKHKSKYIPFSEYPNLKKEYPVLVGNRFRFFDETTAGIMQEAINDLTPKKAKKETEE
ncbi:MAG: hypothetical protein GY836_18155 [Herbaspirillum sp.]|uniref:hypothetical protein n=1 Tax=Herbaspirillum sp. TaxID=1890675 RepID=UPI00258BE68C|nr:hypothetical protein [Herbaspirillum sp.]MCP4557333.1 hypothetical protein [Herbaspirillum sp.]